MIIDKKKLKEREETKKIWLRIFSLSIKISSLIFLLIVVFNIIPQFLLNNMAKYFINHNSYSNAEKCYISILHYEYGIYRNINHTNTKWLNKLADVYIKDKKYDLAILCYQQSISIYKSKEHEKVYSKKIINNLIKIGDIYLMKKETNNALKAYNKALSYSEIYYGVKSQKTINIMNKITKLAIKN